jgi:hypothetical protein
MAAHGPSRKWTAARIGKECAGEVAAGEIVESYVTRGGADKQESHESRWGYSPIACAARQAPTCSSSTARSPASSPDSETSAWSSHRSTCSARSPGRKPLESAERLELDEIAPFPERYSPPRTARTKYGWSFLLAYVSPALKYTVHA